LGEIQPHPGHQLGSGTIIPQQPENDVLRTDRVVAQPLGLRAGVLQCPLSQRAQGVLVDAW
ncbi:MAG TPA: hypothetical protein VIM84_00680, partial [Gemmatimonadales bacterium]